MRIEAAAIALVIGFFINLMTGDPKGILNPARWIRWLTYRFEKFIRKKMPKHRSGQRTGGTIMVILVLIVVLIPPILILEIFYRSDFWLGIAVESIMCCLLLGTKTLKDRSMKVMLALGTHGLKGGQKVASRFTGTDADALDEEGVLKATVATIAEYTSDRVIAPMFYISWGGVIFGYFYKAVNTMDHIVGYRNEKYRYFGTAAARLDDIVNYIPARISALLMIAASWFLQLDTMNAIRIFRRDRYQHTSPNTAQTQSVMAGALDIELPGYIAHTEGPIPGPAIGDPLRQANENDIVHANQLMYVTSVMGLVIMAGIRLLIAWLWSTYLM